MSHWSIAAGEASWWKPLILPDHDLANFNKEIPEGFWASRENNRLYPNVHAFVRFNRFGEHPDVMRARMRAAAQGDLYWPFRERAA